MIETSRRVLRRARAGAAPPEGRAFLLGTLSFLPLFVWWLGWFPGFVSSDTVDQLGQIERFDFTNIHPAFHTFTMWLITRVWNSPGAVSLAQVVVMAGLLGLAARRLSQLGVPAWLAGGTAVAVGALPAVSTTTIALWKDVPFTLALLWGFTELLVLVRDPDAFWEARWPPFRLGMALALVALYRHNGFLTVLAMLVVLGWTQRRRLSRLVSPVATVTLALLAVRMVLFPILDVNAEAIEPGTVFISDVAASLRHEPSNFSEDELDYLASIAPLEVWTERYDCHDSTPLAFAPEFQGTIIENDPGRFRSLAIRTILRDPDTVLGHRWCAASYLFWPPQPGDAYFHRPPYDVWANDRGIARDPISDRAFSVTRSIFVWVEPDGRLWLTWRPALAVWAGAATYAALAGRRRTRHLLVAGALVALQLANVAGTTPAQEFRFAFGIYVMCALSLPLAWFAARPDDLVSPRPNAAETTEPHIPPDPEGTERPAPAAAAPPEA